jgi:hypothetical protein
MESENKPKPDAVPIQVVFQGGGAKLCVLMAADRIARLLPMTKGELDFGFAPSHAATKWPHPHNLRRKSVINR